MLYRIAAATVAVVAVAHESNVGVDHGRSRVMKFFTRGGNMTSTASAAQSNRTGCCCFRSVKIVRKCTSIRCEEFLQLYTCARRYATTRMRSHRIPLLIDRFTRIDCSTTKSLRKSTGPSKDSSQRDRSKSTLSCIGTPRMLSNRTFKIGLGGARTRTLTVLGFSARSLCVDGRWSHTCHIIGRCT